MTNALRLAAFFLPLIALLLPLAAHGAHRPPACLTIDQSGASEALAELKPLLRGHDDVTPRLAGLKAIDEQQLWKILGTAAGEPLDLEEAAALLARLRETGLFARVEPKLAGSTLELQLTENPIVRRLELRGPRELPESELLALLVRTPWPTSLPRDDDDEDGARCPRPMPAREQVARLEGDKVVPGILWQGLPAALQRLSRHLAREGYLLASFSGELTEGGTLTIDVDEGHLERLELTGLHPSLQEAVRAELQLGRGEPFSLAALRSGLSRVRRKWPFLHADGALRAEPQEARIATEDGPDGELRFHTVAPPAGRERRRSLDDDDDDLPFQLDNLLSDPDWPEAPRALRFRARRRGGRALEVDGSTVRLRLRADRVRADTDWVELVRHTQVTGFAPGLPLELRLWDPGDRAHLILNGLIGLNTRRAGRVASGDLFDRMASSERIDWLLGAKVEVPALRLAELGGQIHALTDTPDRWRLSRLDSYLSSMIFNRPESEWLRRAGVTGFATFHFDERLTLGAEYRLDRYGSLDAVRVPTLFNRDEGPYRNPAIDDGLMGSMVFRLEWGSEPVDPRRSKNPWRATETSLWMRDFDEPGLRTLATVEVGNPALGGDFKFTKLVSDTNLLVETGRHETLRLRVRVAGGHDLPLQKQEALGGWEALRGYDFKELRGSWSALATAQYEVHCFGVFADLGSVKQDAGWTDPSLGVGALFHLGDVRFEAAWRTDQRARLAPEARLLFQRAF